MCTLVSKMAVTRHIPMRQESSLPSKVQEAKVQRRSGMCSSSSVAELKTKLHLPSFQSNAFSTSTLSLPKWPAPVLPQPGTCISGWRAGFSFTSCALSTALPTATWATAAGLVLFTIHNSPLITYNAVQFVRVRTLQVQKGLLGPDVTIYCLRGHTRLLVQCTTKNMGTFLSDETSYPSRYSVKVEGGKRGRHWGLFC